MLESLQALFGPVSLAGLLLAAVTVLLAGFLRGFVGFGASLLIVMVLSALFGPLAAVPIANLTGVPATIQLLPTALRDGERSFMIPFAVTSFAAAPLGTLLLVTLDPTLMKIAISLFVLAMVAMLYRGWQLSRRTSPTVLYGGGIGAGFVQGAAGVGGPPAVVVALSRPGTAHEQRGNVIGSVSALGLSSLLPLWYHGLFTREVVTMTLVFMPLYMGATWVGARYFSGKGHKHFRNAALLTTAVIGVVTLGIAVHDFWSG